MRVCIYISPQSGMRVNFLSVKYIKITKNLKTYNSKMFMLSLEMQARRLGGWINSNPHPTWFFTCCLPVSPVSRMELFCERRPPDPGCGEWGGGLLPDDMMSTQGRASRGLGGLHPRMSAGGQRRAWPDTPCSPGREPKCPNCHQKAFLFVGFVQNPMRFEYVS